MQNDTNNLVLYVLAGPDMGRSFPLGRTTIVGSRPRNDVALSDPNLADMHLRITLRAGGYHLADLTDAHDVTVNGRVVKARPLAEGDRITLGGTELQLLSPDNVPQQAAPAAIPVTLKPPVAEEAPPQPALPAKPATPSPSPAPPRAPQTSSAPSSSTGRPFIPLLVVAVLAVLAVGGFMLYRKALVQSAMRDYKAVTAVELQFPEDYELILEKLAAFEASHQTVGPRVTALVSQKRSELQDAIEAREQAFAELLARLDTQSGELVTENRYEDAIALYESVEDAGQRKRVLDSRRSRLDEIRAQFSAWQATQATELAARQSAARDAAAAAWHDAGNGAAEALLRGDYDSATDLLSTVRNGSGWELLAATAHNQLASATNTIEELRAYSHATYGTNSENSVHAETAFQPLSPAAKAVVLIKRGDLLTAMGWLERASGSIFRETLHARVNASPEALAREREAAQTYARAWATVIGSEAITSMPTPAKCLEAINALAGEIEPAPLRRRLDPLIRYRIENPEASLTLRYEPVFELAETLVQQAGLRQAVASARIIELDGRTCYFETKHRLEAEEAYTAGLFSEPIVYNSLLDGRPLATRVQIYQAQPTRVIGEHSGMFSLPESFTADLPAPGTPIVVDKELSVGPRIIRAPGSAWSKPFSDRAISVAGATEDGQHALLTMAAQTDASSLRPGRTLYFFDLSPDGRIRNQAVGRVEEIHADLTLCRIATGRVDAASIVSLLPRPAASLTRITPEAMARAHLIFGKPVSEPDAAGTVTIKPDMFQPVPPVGYLYDVLDVMTHPTTREVLSVRLDSGIKAASWMKDGAIRAKPVGPPLSPQPHSQGLLVSSLALGSIPSTIDLPGRVLSYRSGKTDGDEFWRSFENPVWEPESTRTSGIQLGLQESTGPCLEVASPLRGYGQCDFDLTVLHADSSRNKEWARGVMIELYSTDRKEGVTFSLGAGSEGGGISVLGATRGRLKESRGKTRGDAPSLPKGCVAMQPDAWKALPPALLPEHPYRLCVRRAGEKIALYVNGKRLGSVGWSESAGQPLRVSLMAPGAVVKVSAASSRPLSRQTIVPVEEPLLGDFGYVVRVEANVITVDRATHNLDVNSPLSIVELDKVVHGDTTTIISARRIATARVDRVGELTATARIIEQSKPITRGMKVFVGSWPERTFLSPERLHDITLGL